LAGVLVVGDLYFNMSIIFTLSNVTLIYNHFTTLISLRRGRKKFTPHSLSAHPTTNRSGRTTQSGGCESSSDRGHQMASRRWLRPPSKVWANFFELMWQLGDENADADAVISNICIRIRIMQLSFVGIHNRVVIVLLNAVIILYPHMR
jgi:hypothetical protein